MAKRGGSTHMKRLAAPKAIPITDKKETKWITRPAPGPHLKNKSIPLGVLLRDILGVVSTLREAKKALNARYILVDGIARTDEKYPVGFMDVLTLAPEKKSFRIVVDWKARLIPLEIKAAEAENKILKVTNKHVINGGKINLTFHDGRNILADNHIAVGDSVVMQLPKSRKEKAKMLKHLKLEPGAHCFISEGKHAGKLITLKELVPRVGRKTEAVVESGKESFITVSEYLLVVDKDFEVKE